MIEKNIKTKVETKKKQPKPVSENGRIYITATYL